MGHIQLLSVRVDIWTEAVSSISAPSQCAILC